MDNSDRSALVIGAGIAGQAAAISLARAGLQVTLVDEMPPNHDAPYYGPSKPTAR